ncbi:MAG: phosphate-starvation-inducible PsiE family protein [Gemmatimonadota bacterium]|nr:MAG: phosphate-starvation-inducible PsiE family protein [Gemmatimonadota bacterium]
MTKVLNYFERYIVLVLMVMMMLVVLVLTVELGIIIGRELIKQPKLLLNFKEILEVFGFFFMILIGLELIDTIKSYLTEERMHVEIVFLVAMIAIARKVIILDLKTLSALTLLGMAAIILALAAGYFFVKLAHRGVKFDDDGRKQK